MNQNEDLDQTKDANDNMGKVNTDDQVQSEINQEDSSKAGSSLEGSLDNSGINSNSSLSENTPDETPKNNTLYESLGRLFKDAKIRIFVVLFFVICLVYSIYSFMSSKEPETLNETPEQSTIPSTNARAAAYVSKEDLANIQQRQEAEANKVKDGESYIAGLVPVREDPNTQVVGDEKPIQLGEGLKYNDQDKAKTYTDQTGKVYSAEQAAQLSASGQIIDGVTSGSGSINDASALAPTYAAPESARIPTSQNIQQGKDVSVNSTSEIYVVKPYVKTSTTTSDAAQTSIDSLNESASRSNQWAQAQIEISQKKAALVQEKSNSAFISQIKMYESLKGTGLPKNSYSSKVVRYQKDSENPKEIEVGSADTKTPNARSETNSSSQVTGIKPLARSGDTFKAITISEVNTDEGSEVLARIQSGPLKGATIIGAVKPTEKNMQFVFTKVLRKNQPALTVDAVARQIGSNKLGMADKIQTHTFQRYAALGASSALKGVGEAYRQTSGQNANMQNGIVVTNTTDPSSDRIKGNVVGELGNQISSDILDQSRRKPTYITYSGKVFNLFINSDILEGK